MDAQITEDEIQLLRLKLALAANATACPFGMDPQWAIVALPICKDFRWKQPFDTFYRTEVEALKDGLDIALSGRAVEWDE